MEVTYLNINEETILSEIYEIESSQTEATVIPSYSSDQETEEIQESFIVEIEDDHGAVAKDYLDEKITFEEFINQLENSDGSSPSSDISSEESSDDDDDDEEFLPERKTSYPVTKKPTEPLKEKVS